MIALASELTAGQWFMISGGLLFLLGLGLIGTLIRRRPVPEPEVRVITKARLDSFGPVVGGGYSAGFTVVEPGPRHVPYGRVADRTRIMHSPQTRGPRNR